MTLQARPPGRLTRSTAVCEQAMPEWPLPPQQAQEQHQPEGCLEEDGGPQQMGARLTAMPEWCFEQDAGPSMVAVFLRVVLCMQSPKRQGLLPKKAATLCPRSRRSLARPA